LITGLDLKDFRGIKSTTRPITLEKINILIGRNNSGKTSILEALNLTPSPLSLLPLSGYTKLDYTIMPHQGKPASLIYGYAGFATIDYIYSEGTVTIKLEENKRFTFEWKDSEKRIHKSYAEPSVFLEGEPAGRIFKSYTSCYYSGWYHRFLYDKLLQDENVWRTIEKQRAHNRVVKELINPSVADTFTEILIYKDTLHARKEFPDGTSSYIRIFELGDGVQRVIIPFLWFEAAKPRIVLWDDLEASMHPSLIENVLRWLAEGDWQVVISTHSLDVLSALTYVRPPSGQIIILRKSADDMLDYQTLSIDELETLIESNTDPRKLADLLALR
jgi:predicted ATP-dependent endonuclease of OLD family